MYFKLKDGRLLPGAGAVEVELAKQLTSISEVLIKLQSFKFQVILYC